MTNSIDKRVDYELRYFFRQFKTLGIPFIFGLALRIFDKDYLGIINDDMFPALFTCTSISFTLIFLAYFRRYLIWRKKRQTSVLVSSFYVLITFLFLSGILVSLLCLEKDEKEDEYYLHLIISAITVAFYLLYRQVVIFKNKSRQSND